MGIIHNLSIYDDRANAITFNIRDCFINKTFSVLILNKIYIICNITYGDIIEQILSTEK